MNFTIIASEKNADKRKLKKDANVQLCTQYRSYVLGQILELILFARPSVRETREHPACGGLEAVRRVRRMSELPLLQERSDRFVFVLHANKLMPTNLPTKST